MSEIITRLSSALADRYRIEREIGRGGMATVYLARDLKHDRDVALKVLRPELAAVLGVNRFLNEIRISARLDHPHILTLIDSGAADGFLYYVMPFVRGESLRDRLKREKQLGIDEALDIAKQITSALDYAHRQGIVHRDIKPENILLHEGEAMLADFGIAMAAMEAGGSRLTESGVSLGTPQYMSPEQATGDRPLDSRSDIYSIAAVLYEMLGGEPPHTGASVQAVIAKLLTERPTRLRVIRDTVPAAVDAAVAKALAKLPADRYATAADFARALATPRASALRRLSFPSRTSVLVAIGGTVVTLVAIASALIFSRKGDSRPLPDLVQLTLSGNAVAPSQSPNAPRVAFAEKQCDQAGLCTYQLVIQELDGTGRLVLTRNIGYIYKTQWTSDGRFIEFAGSHPPSRQGSFAVSTLGGETRFLGCCFFDLLAGDTSFLHVGSVAGADRAWVRRLTIHDGRTVDSILVRDSIPDYYTVGLSIPNRLIVATGKTSEYPPELRLTDFSGQIIHRISPPFASLGRAYRARWVPSKQRLAISSQRELGGSEFDILTMKVTPSAIGPDVDTVFVGMQGDGFFDISPDGERLVYSAGLVETSLSIIDIDRIPLGKPAKPVTSSTTLLRGRISPAGDKILLARDAPRAGTHASQFSIMSRAGGVESRIPAAVENLLDFHWSPDGARIMYLHGIAGNKVRLMEMDTTGRGPRIVTELEQSEALQFYPLADGAVCIMPPDRRSISIIRPGKGNVAWHVPKSIIGTISVSPDAKAIALGVLNLTFDSVLVATLHIESGRFTTIATVAGRDAGALAWLEDDSFMLVFREPLGNLAFYRIAKGQPAKRLGALPYSEAQFSVSNNGRHAAVFSYSDKKDVYMIRNFGKMLRK